MKIKVTGRHSSVSRQMKEYALEKAERLERFFDRIQSAELILNIEGGRNVAEIRVAVPGDAHFGKEESEDMYSSIDLLVDNIGRQLRRYKGRLRDRRGQAPEAPAPVEDADEDDETYKNVFSEMAES